MTKLFTRNSKLKKASVYTVNFGIPALKTCPMAKTCKDYCYANKGAYSWPVVKAAYEYRYQCTKSKDFFEVATAELNKIKKLKAVRIHDSGDFYNKRYLEKWIKIASSMPDKIFYFYTKRVTLIKDYATQGLLPDNMIYILSVGGSEDRHIDMENDRHSRIFNSLKELKAAGYVDATEDDTKAWKSKNNKIGLVIH
jgi:hypothetical protein